MNDLEKNRLEHNFTVALFALAGSVLTMLGLWSLFFSPLKGDVINNLASCLVFLMGIGFLACIINLNNGFKARQRAIRNGMNAKIVSLGKNEKPKRKTPKKIPPVT